MSKLSGWLGVMLIVAGTGLMFITKQTPPQATPIPEEVSFAPVVACVNNNPDIISCNVEYPQGATPNSDITLTALNRTDFVVGYLDEEGIQVSYTITVT